jgi:uncharacterized lipoprotein YmbA
MKTRARLPAFACSLLLLAGCASQRPAAFHTLMAPPAEAASAAPASGLRLRIESPVRVPAQVDQPQLVLRRADGSLQVLEDERWVAPLADEWRDALADGLARRLGALDVSRIAPPPGPPPYALQLELQRFDSEPGAQAVQQAQWSVKRPGEDVPALSCVTTIAEPAGTGVASLAAAHRRALARLADALASAVRALQASRQAGCPGTGG